MDYVDFFEFSDGTKVYVRDTEARESVTQLSSKVNTDINFLSESVNAKINEANSKISDNTEAISSNTSNIATNTQDIQANKEDIAFLKKFWVYVSECEGDTPLNKFKDAVSKAKSENKNIYVDEEITISFRANYSIEIDFPVKITGKPIHIEELVDANGAFYILHHTKNVEIYGIDFYCDAGYVINTKGINNKIYNCNFYVTGTATAIRFCNHDNAISNCTFYGETTGTVIEHNALDGDDGENWTINNRISNCHVENKGTGAGLLICKTTSAHLPEGLEVSNVTFIGNKNANSNVIIDACYYCDFSGCIFDQCKAQNVALRAKDDIVKGIVFDGCYFGSNIRTIIGVYSIATNSVSCVTITDCYSNIKILQAESNTQYVVIANNQVECNDVCVWISKAKDIIANSNIFNTSGSYYFYYDAGEEGIVVSKNNIKKGGATGSYTPDTNGFFDDYPS